MCTVSESMDGEKDDTSYVPRTTSKTSECENVNLRRLDISMCAARKTPPLSFGLHQTLDRGKN